ncbi:SDR family NAD(P)-dependent oxidoreductase [Paraburkholderia dipogonis]|jgi:NAD(P)-dependent dehydrogenase (short-subunit alcohol dehydrogenase family)|uniref:SDR family NAD(P)-dependent oxidoreductase n=1 Tax=Paraburkholderia dipogonis TaxID=1211383 RepID=UPI0038B93392
MSKTAVVTGGASGIGRCTVEKLMTDGWTVWVLDLSEGKAEESADASRYRFQRCDVGNAESVKAAFDEIKRHSEKLDAMICSAGVIRTGSLEQHTLEQVDAMIGVNLKGPWLCVREALPLLRKDSSVTDPSRVVIVGSIGGIRPKVGTGFYGATKAAVHVLTGVLAAELAPTGVLVNAVAPGTVATPMIESVQTSQDGSGYKLSGDSPLGRIAQPEDVVDVIMFFLSDASRFVNGTILPVDGGTRAAFIKK